MLLKERHQGALTIAHQTQAHASANSLHLAAVIAFSALTRPRKSESSSHSLACCDNLLSVLFFNGGARGNPGPAGSGSVIVNVVSDAFLPHIHWMASVSYAARSTTANYAGTEVCLSVSARRSYNILRGIIGVGDSPFIH